MSECKEIKENVVWREVEGEVLLLDISSGHYYTLDPIGSEIWQQLNAKQPISKIVSVVSEKYGVPSSTVENDIHELVEQLKKENLCN